MVMRNDSLQNILPVGPVCPLFSEAGKEAMCTALGPHSLPNLVCLPATQHLESKPRKQIKSPTQSYILI